MRRRTTACLGLGSLLGLFLISPANAAELISIPVDRVIFGAAGDEILVASADVPPELVGRSCEMTGESRNQESVHRGNDLLINIAGQTRVLADFEDERDLRHTFRQIAELPARVDVFVRLGPDGVSSGGFLISIECDTEPPATTTSTTTTSTTTSTTSTSTTTTSAAPTSPPTPTPPPTPTSPPTPTISIAGPTSSPPTAVVSQVDPPPRRELAVTGTNTGALAALGIGLFGLGAVALGQGVRIRSRA